MRFNTLVRDTNYQGGPAQVLSPEKQLAKVCMACMLFEDTFYMNGKDIFQIINDLSLKVESEYIAGLAIEAKEKGFLRHLPLLLAVLLLRKGYKASQLIERVLTRPDEIGELIALYWKDGKRPLSKQLRKGIAKAFHKFDEYQLAKWDRKGKVSLKDAMILCHPKPANKEQGELWKRLLEGKLETPKTRETMLSAGKSAFETYTELMDQKKLGLTACIKNLKTMIDSGIDHNRITQYLLDSKGKVLPFEIITAMKYAPSMVQALDYVLLKSLGDIKPMPGKTHIFVDVSGSMDTNMSSRGETTYLDGASGLAILAREMFPDSRIFTFSNRTVEVPNIRGLGLYYAIRDSQPHLGTYLGPDTLKFWNCDRLIIITDEQIQNQVIKPFNKGYICNVAPYNKGISSYQGWECINGFSPKLLHYIQEFEKEAS